MRHPTRSPRHVAIVTLLLGGLLLCLGTLRAGAAEPSRLEVAADFNAGTVTVVGRLSSEGRGIRNARVDVSVGPAAAGSARTDGQGRFLHRFAFEATPGDHVISVTFRGNDRFERVRADVTVSVASPTPSPPASPSTRPPSPTPTTPTPTPSPTTPTRTPTPTPTRSAETSLALTVSPESAYPGEVLTLTGRLTSEGAPLGASRISFAIGGREQPDALVFTDSDGRFLTYLEVPQSLRPGEATVTATFAGREGLQPTRRAVPVEIRKVEAESPTPSPTSPSASPSATASGTVPAEPTATAPTAPGPEATVPAEPEGGAFPWSWVLLALVAVGGISLLVLVGLLIRRVVSPGEADDDMDLIGEAPEELDDRG